MLKSSLLALVIVCTLMSALALSATTDTSRTNSLFQFAVPVDHITIQGPLRDRLLRNYDRLERSEYEPAQVFRLDANNQQWPGDYAGRTILALANLQRITGRKSRYLDTLLAELPQHLNERGYMGAISSGIDEQQLAGNGWLVSGLLAAHEVTGNTQALTIARGIVTNLFLPTRAHFASYPCTPETRTANSGGASGTRVGTHGEWQLSTDIGCAFIMLEGLVDAYATFGGDDLKALIDEMCTVFATIDLEGTSVQLHATLTAIRQLLHYHDLTSNPTVLALAQRVYDNYRIKAMTENFANYNWFNRPTWTEPCAIVDSFIVATSLWRKTGDPSYLEDAHAIYFNALGYAQKPHGGFGCDNCVGAEEPVLFNKVYDVTWCCNMRGAVGLSHAADFTYLQTADALVLPFYFDSTAQVTFPNGHMTVSETTAYPREGQVTLQVTDSTVKGKKVLRLFVPSWAKPADITVRINGLRAKVAVQDGFVAIKRRFRAGDTIKLTFPCTLRVVAPHNVHTIPGYQTFWHGPLILGTNAPEGDPALATLHMSAPGIYEDSKTGVQLRPIDDTYTLSDAAAQADHRRILFHTTPPDSNAQ